MNCDSCELVRVVRADVTGGEWAGQADTPPSLEQGECRGEDAEQEAFSNISIDINNFYIILTL